MNEKLYKFILQSLSLISITILACIKVIDSIAIVSILCTIIGYLFGSNLEAYKNKNDDIKKDEEK